MLYFHFTPRGSNSPTNIAKLRHFDFLKPLLAMSCCSGYLSVWFQTSQQFLFTRYFFFFFFLEIYFVKWKGFNVVKFPIDLQQFIKNLQPKVGTNNQVNSILFRRRSDAWCLLSMSASQSASRVVNWSVEEKMDLTKGPWSIYNMSSAISKALGKYMDRYLCWVICKNGEINSERERTKKTKINFCVYHNPYLKGKV